MEFEKAVEEIKASWKSLYPASKDKKGIICPLPSCGHGAHGDGIVRNTKSKNKNALICFACGFKGSVIDLIQQEKSMEFKEAVQYAAGQLGISIDEDQAGFQVKRTAPAKAQKEQQVQEEPKAAEPIADYRAYYTQCKARINDERAKEYLQSRGISLKTAESYFIGYDDKWISPAAIAKLEAEGNSWRPGATARIIIPVSRNHYIARAIDSSIEKKYAKMNEIGGGDVCIFNKSALYDSGTVFITEGAFDALSIIEAGGEAIALNSTSNADKLAQLLKEQPTTATLILCLDNDEAGNKTTEALKSKLDALHVKNYKANICAGYKDANEALTGNKERFFEVIEKEKQRAQEGEKDDLQGFLDKVRTDLYKPYATGLKFFDDLLAGGIMPQTLSLLLAAPGTGKTTLCQQIAEEMAQNGKPIVYLNLEMSREQMLAKAISRRLFKKNRPMSAKHILQGYNWSEQDEREITAEIEAYRADSYKYIKYNPDNVGTDINNILGYLHEIGEQAKGKGEQAPAVVVDYFHLITTTERLEVQELIKKAIFGLKKYAMDYNTFVLGIVATNRTASGGQITLDSGRDSSNIEYTGDYVLSLNYFEIDNNNVGTNKVEEIAKLQNEEYRKMIIRVLKGRMIPPGKKATVYFNAAHNTFYGEEEWRPTDPAKTPFTNLSRKPL